jgi:hypothetical protein
MKQESLGQAIGRPAGRHHTTRRETGGDVTSAFDFDAFKRALASRDAAVWTGFYADDAEWIDWHASPPNAPYVMRGRERSAVSFDGSRHNRSSSGAVGFA